MFDNIKEFFRTIFRSRLLVAATVMVLLFSVLIFRMFQLQIIKGAEYQDNYTLKIVRERTLNSTRGNILPKMNSHIPLRSTILVLMILPKKKINF